MENHPLEAGKQREQGVAASSRGPDVAASPPLHPFLQLQQQAGNQAVQELLRTGMIQAKLAISNPDDPEEREADQVANTIMRSHAGFPISSACSCAEGGEMCEECQQKQPQKKIQRHAATPGAPAHVPHIVRDVLRSRGQPLDARTRAFFEPRFGRDFSHVRVHTGHDAERAADDIHAHAFTTGLDIYFAPGQFAPESDQGRKLLAHELTHTAQQSGDDSIRRQLDPTNTAAWDWYGAERHRKDPSYLQTVAAAPDAAKDLTNKISDSGAPKTDDEREALDAQIKTLIRLHGVEMVGAHRAELVLKKQQFEAMTQRTGAPDQTGSAAGGGVSPGAADTATAIRAAAQRTILLNTEKEELRDVSGETDRAVRLNAGPDEIDEEYKTLWDKAQPRSAPSALRWLFETRNQLAENDLSWGYKKLALFKLRDNLLALRHEQIQGIDVSLAILYTSFPFFADLSASYIMTGKKLGGPMEKLSGKSGKVAAFGLALSSIANPLQIPFAAYVAHDVFKADKPLDDQTLLSEVQASFDRLIEHTDEAIVKVGSGSINPLDLPGAVAATQNTLSPELRTELNRIQQAHEVAKFERDMILALGMGVLTGLTGGLAGVGLAAYATAAGVAATSAGVVQVGIQMKEMLDRQTLGAASTDPQGKLLGVSAPTTFEWALFGVGAALTAADLAGLAKEITATHPHFNEEPHVPTTTTESHPATSKQGEPIKPADHETPRVPEIPPQTGKVVPANPAEARVLEAGKGDAVPSSEQLESELAIVEQTESRPVPGKEYKAEVELPNKHTWRETPEGQWCRFSDGRICLPGSKGKTTKELLTSEQDIDKLVEPLRPDLSKPPATVKTTADQDTWALYNDYFADRVDKMKADIHADGQTKRNLPWTFDEFKQRWGDPEVARMLKGRLRQSQIGSEIDRLVETGGVVTQDTAIARVQDPTSEAGQIRRPDFLWPDEKGGFTAVSVKARGFTEGMNPEQLHEIVMPDIRNAIEDYYGLRYVRSKAHSLVGEQIKINEVVVNYVKVPESLRKEIEAIANEYKAFNVRIGFFELP